MRKMSNEEDKEEIEERQIEEAAENMDLKDVLEKSVIVDTNLELAVKKLLEEARELCQKDTIETELKVQRHFNMYDAQKKAEKSCNNAETLIGYATGILNKKKVIPIVQDVNIETLSKMEQKAIRRKVLDKIQLEMYG
jgi:hypothetical protein